MGSCDFALGNYAYVEEGDGVLSTFSIAHDEKEILPLVKDAQEACGKEMAFMAAPWSPPAFMKTNGEMNHGGKLKREYYEAWAVYFVKFLEAYKKAGIPVRFLRRRMSRWRCRRGIPVFIRPRRKRSLCGTIWDRR